MAACRSDFIWSPQFRAYDFGAEHPMRPERLLALHDLLRRTGALDGSHVRTVMPPAAAESELLLAHSEAYIEAVRRLSTGAEDRIRAEVFGLGEGDTPAFAGMHDAATLIAGGTLTAARAIMRGETLHAFNPAGGLHHAHRARASGFCVYNDLAVAIAAVVQEHEAKVLYVDFDVHHGDGVQAAFYDDPRVLTVSLHETGRYLFPGTGGVTELGTGAAIGYSINVPLAAFTQDESWIASVESLMPALVERFQPDLIVSQFGCDGHTWDGQAHLRLTTAAYARAAALMHELAHEHCSGRWLATGGGGYEPVRVVPRAWALVWAEMASVTLPEALPVSWITTWEPHAYGPMPERMVDLPEISGTIPRRPMIEQENASTVARVRELALSPQLRQAYRPSGPWTPSTFPWLPTGRAAVAETAKGAVHLRDRCPRSLIERMHVAEGMQAFSRSAEREAAMLRRIAERPENNLVIAHTAEGEIVGEVTLAPGEGRWLGLDSLYEAAIEIAPGWRGAGLAETLLRFTFEPEFAERLIVIAQGISWHWDLEGTGMDAWTYREQIIKLFATAGFEVFPTDDPEILSGEANVLLARVGKEAPHDLYDEFYRRLHRQSDWIGF